MGRGWGEGRDGDVIKKDWRAVGMAGGGGGQKRRRVGRRVKRRGLGSRVMDTGGKKM